MSLSRFHLPTAEWTGPQLILSGDEAQHCARVLRKVVGEEIEIFDGAGRVALAKITHLYKTAITTTIVSEQTFPPLPHAIHLLPALIKAEPFEWLLEKAVELGAASIQPLITERTIIHLSGEHLEKKLIKWRRHMVESAKQCHTPFLPRLEKPRPFSEVIPNLATGTLKILPSLSEGTRTLHQLPFTTTTAFIAIGPEGDFSPAEEALCQRHGFQPITLGPLILRAETATIAALTLLSHELTRPVSRE